MNQLCLEWGDHLGGGKLIKRDNVGPDGSLSGSTFRDQHAKSDILEEEQKTLMSGLDPDINLCQDLMSGSHVGIRCAFFSWISRFYC